MSLELKNGLLLVDKQPDCTSHDVVVQARRLLRTKKIGHCGTLDPGATGLLILTVGRATRLTRFLIKAPKVYEGSAQFGTVTDTYDLAGQVTEEHPVEGLDDDTIRQVMATFHGTYMQTPPPYCAKKVGGVKYYELARRGEATPDEKSPVTVFDYAPLQPYEPGKPLPFLLSCASGTYARSLVHELGQKLGCGAALASLRRTQIGSSFHLAQALTLDELHERSDRGEAPGDAWIPFDDIQLPFDEVAMDAQQAKRIEHGQTVLVRGLESGEGDWVKLVDPRQRFIAVGAVTERIGSGDVGIVQPKVVFH